VYGQQPIQYSFGGAGSFDGVEYGAEGDLDREATVPSGTKESIGETCPCGPGKSRLRFSHRNLVLFVCLDEQRCLLHRLQGGPVCDAFSVDPHEVVSG
jgi:hypothetical protein